MPIDILGVLREAVRRGASDIHMVADAPAMIRVNGELSPMLGVPTIDNKTFTALIFQMMTDLQRASFERELTVNATFTLEGVRFRSNVTLQRNGLEAVFRIISAHIPTPEELMLPPPVVKLVEVNRGLILVTGPTGSGKSTTLACLVDHINQTRRAKIITLEDPIEFIHTNKNSFVSQREIGQHAPSFAVAMREILRQDPDVVLLGEMRDYETMAAAMQVADTGHLVLATLHSVDAPLAVERIVDVFPGPEQHQVRAQLAAILRGVVAQTLVPRLDSVGRVAAFEVMMVNSAIATMIRQGRTHEIYSAIEMGSTEGMRSLSRSMHELAKAGMIEMRYALSPTASTPMARSDSNVQRSENPERRRPL